MNSTVTLLRYSLTDKGWRRGAVVITKNGKLKADAMMVGGREVYAPNGRFQMRRYQGKLPVYTELGSDPADALARFKAEESKLSAKVEARAAGLEIVEEITRKTLKQWAADFLQMHRNLPHRSDDSIEKYTKVTGTFLVVTKAAYPDAVTEADFIKFHGHLRKTLGHSDRYCADLYLSLRGFLRYCEVDPGKIVSVGVHKLLKTYTKKKPNTYTPEVVGKLMEAANDENRALLWDFAYKTGLRDSELQMVTRDDLHGLDTPGPLVHVKERDEYGKIKDAEERLIDLHPSLVAPLNAWLEANPTRKLLFGTENDKPDGHMLRALKRDARRAGLNCGQCKGCKGSNIECREYTLHRFRRTYTTRLLRAAKGDLRSVMEKTGHSDIETVMRYLEPSENMRQATADAF
jgi:integrase